VGEALAEQQRRQHERHRRLSHEDHRCDLDRGPRLQAAHLAEHAHHRCRSRGQPPKRRRQQVAGREVIGCQLRRHGAPPEGHAGAHHRDLGEVMAERAEHVGQQAEQSQRHQHERDRELLGGVRRAARRSAQRRPDDPQHDRRHRQVLVPAGTLTEHALGDHEQHHQPHRERRLHDHQRREQQREHLQRPAEHGQARAEQPARALQEPPHEREAQVILARRPLGVVRLERDA